MFPLHDALLERVLRICLKLRDVIVIASAVKNGRAVLRSRENLSALGIFSSQTCSHIQVNGIPERLISVLICLGFHYSVD